ncbi:hypothetical protein SLS60_005142 [Paraconiothyrium brasiliense]|uniref:Uncharacterized protein n=1 Tax=Paraconiothyrium brasiliense TaxID=300254 RepID=A0ABR3RHC9_9PLEO
MQRTFRSVIRKQIKVNIAACYATRFVPNNKLHLASEWAVLPDFEPIPIDKSHFEMTKLYGEDPDFFKIAKLLHKWAEELRSKSFKDEELPSPRDPLSDLRKILGYVKPQLNSRADTSVPGKGPQEPEDRPPNVSRSGITVLYSKGKESKVDIVLVHGVNGDPEKTWTHSNTKFFWPWDLRKHLPGARVMVYGYDVDFSPELTFYSIKAGDLQNIARVAFTNVPPRLLYDLQDYPRELVALEYAFRRTINTLKQVEICSCMETLKTPKVGALVVDQDSAVMGIENEETVFLDADHENMVKFTDEKDRSYEKVVVPDMLSSLVQSQWSGGSIASLCFEEYAETNYVGQPSSMLSSYL